MTVHPPDPQIHVDDDPDDQLFPVLMVYATMRLSVAGGWRWSVRVATPDSSTVLQASSTSGGSLDQGRRKSMKYLDDALALATEYLLPTLPFDECTE